MSNIDYTAIRGKKVLLYSGGMDCYIINQLEKPDVLLYINNHSNYSDIEMQKLLDLRDNKKAPWLRNLVIVDGFINMKDIERDDFIIPARNAYFILKAAEYGDEIIMGATSGDRSTDKDLLFAKQMEDLLNHIYTPSHWCKDGRTIRVDFKYKSFTKQDLITALMTERVRQHPRVDFDEIKEMVIAELFGNSWSCYNPDHDHESCGICKPCLRKWLAILGATNIDTSKQFVNSPREYFTPERIDEWITRESDCENNRGRESAEIIYTLKALRSGEI